MGRDLEGGGTAAETFGDSGKAKPPSKWESCLFCICAGFMLCCMGGRQGSSGKIDHLANTRRNLEAATSSFPLDPEMLNPRYKAECGDFLKEYALFHRRELQRLRSEKEGTTNATGGPVKLLVFRVTPGRSGGLGDRLRGLISTFKVALIVKRVFVVDWEGFDKLFYSPFLNLAYEAELFQRNRTTYFKNWGMDTDILLDEVMGKGDIDTVIAVCNGLSTNLTYSGGFKGKYYGRIPPPFSDWPHIKRNNSFGCLVNSLAQPTQRLRDHAASIIDWPLQDTVNMAATNARWGDPGMKAGNAKPEETNMKNFVTGRLNAKANLEKQIKEEGAVQLDEGLQLFIVTDNNDLKDYVAKTFANQTRMTRIAPTHIDHPEYQVGRVNHTKTPEEVMLDTVAEWWIFGQCRYYITDAGSGYVRTAVAYSLRANSTMDMSHYKSKDSNPLVSVDALKNLRRNQNVLK